MQSHITDQNAIVSIFDDHASAESAVRKLGESGIDMKHISIVGKGYHTDEHVTGFYNMGDRVQFWGSRGAVWGGLWGLLFGGVFLTVPVVGPVVVIGTLASMVIAAIEGAVVVGGLSAVGAAIYGMGIPKDSVVAYETALKADKFLVMVNGPSEELRRAKVMLHTYNPSLLDHHTTLDQPVAARSKPDQTGETVALMTPAPVPSPVE